MDQDQPEQVAQVDTTLPEPSTEPALPSSEQPGTSPTTTPELVQQRHPVPSAAEQAKVTALIDSTYNPDNITKPSEKLELAGRLLELAKKPGDNLTERFVLLRKAAELARDAGDAGLMLSAVDVMGEQFEIAPLNVKGKLLLQFAEDARDKAAISSLAENISGPIDEALAAGRPDAAYAIIDAGYNAAMRARATQHRKALHDQRESVLKLYEPWLKNRQALAALQKNPDHPEANLAAGRYACFTEGKWDEGLPMLAKGSNAALQVVAKQELASPNDSLSQVALADAWWTAAESEPKEIQPILKRHAGDWYQRALPSITSVVVKDKCTRRLAEVARLAPGAPQFVTETLPAAPTQPDTPSRGRTPGLAVAPFDARRAKQYQQVWAKHLKLPPELSLDLGNGVKMVFVLVPPGEFMMGSSDAEREIALARQRIDWARARIPTEGPQHKVKISQAFYLGKFEVTQSQWQAVMGKNPSHFKAPMNPVEMVNWDDIQPFLAKLNAAFEEKGMVFGLPTEAQWEYACRAGTTTAFCCGDDVSLLNEYAWSDANAGGKTRPVGQRRPNAWGFHDMHGNVWEWCADWHSPDYYAKSPPVDPVGPAGGSIRVIRGGFWSHPPSLCRAAFRHHDPPHFRYDTHGFRVVCTPLSEEEIKSRDTGSIAESAKGPAFFPKDTWVDITDSIDPQAHTIQGDWQLVDATEGVPLQLQTEHTKGKVLVCKGGGIIVLPVVAGDEKFELRYTIHRVDGRKDIGVTLPFGNSHGRARDFSGDGRIGLEWLNGAHVGHPDNPIDVSIPSADGRTMRHVVTPLGNNEYEYKRFVDEELLLEWKGPASSLTTHKNWRNILKGVRNIFLDCYQASCIYSDLEFKSHSGKAIFTGKRASDADSRGMPVPKSADAGVKQAAIDLLARLKNGQAQKVVVRSDWDQQPDGSLRVRSAKDAFMQIQHEPISGDFSLTVDVVRLTGKNQIVVVFPVGSTCCDFWVDEWGNKARLGRMKNNPPADVVRKLIANNRVHRIQITVQRNDEMAAITASVNGLLVFRWVGSETDVQPRSHDAKKPLVGLGAYECDAVFRRVTIGPLAETGR